MSNTIDEAMLAKVREAEAFLRANKGILKDAEDARRADLGTLGSDLITHVVETGEYRESDKSDWAGFSENGIPVTIDGTKYTVSLTVTDVERKDVRAAERKAAEAEAAKAPTVTVA